MAFCISIYYNYYVKISRRTILEIIVCVLFAVSLIFIGVRYYTKPLTSLNVPDEAMISNIEAYLDQISPSMVPDVQSLATQYNLQSWGCGPTSYALANIINDKFFNGKAPIMVNYNNHPYEISLIFHFADGNANIKNGAIVDHTFIEIYLHNKILFIDPTIGQFGRYPAKIAYQEFTVGDPNIAETLKNDYGIEDMGVRRLTKKAVDNVPVDQQPYPGFQINKADLPYYQTLATNINLIEAGGEPEAWLPWVDFLRGRYH